MKQLENWTNKKCGEVVFDSCKDDYYNNTSVFDSKIKGKANLAFIMEDIRGNKFGGYITSTINTLQTWITDHNAFVFSLKSNGRLDGMKKFKCVKPENAFNVNNQNGEWYSILFGGNGGIGYDITLRKENRKLESYCHQECYDYENIPNALTGERSFVLKRMTVIQMK